MIDVAIVGAEEYFVAEVLPKRQWPQATGIEQRSFPVARRHLLEPEDFPAAQIGKEIRALQAGKALPTVDIAPNNGTPPRVAPVPVDRHRQLQPARITIDRRV